jgi:hypothetical protein
MKTHEDYNEYCLRWHKCRAFAFGDEHEVKELNNHVIPRLSKENDEDYKQRINYAHVDNKVSASMWIYKGLAFRKPPILSKVNSKQQAYIDDIDGNGTSVIDMAKKLHEEHIAITRYGILIDSTPAIEGESLSEYQTKGGRSKICFYSAESILDWNYSGGKLNYVVLKEDYHQVDFNIKDGFEKKSLELWRTLDVIDGIYRVITWKKNDKLIYSDKSFVMVGEPIYPMANGENMTYIPFKIYPEIEPSIPMIMGLVDSNIAHLKADVMDANLCRLIATPTPVFAGIPELSDPQNPAEINLSRAINTNNPNAKWGYLEMNGNGASAIQARLSRLLDEMVAEGSSLLKSSPKAIESAESAGIRNMGDNSKLSTVALYIESVLNWAVNKLFEWDGIEGDHFSIELNRDMLPYAMSSQMIDSLIRGVQVGEISRQTLFYNMQKGEMYPDNWSVDDETASISEMP